MNTPTFIDVPINTATLSLAPRANRSDWRRAKCDA